MARRSATTPLQHWITVLATVFVVGGIVAIVQLRPERSELERGGLTASDATLSGRVVVYADHGAVRVVDAEEGVELRECAVAEDARIFDVTREGVEVGLSSGDRVRIGFDCVARAAGSGVIISEPDDEAVSRVVFGDGTEAVLVAENGRPFREAQAVGWMDDTHVGLVAFRGDARVALAVGMDGSLEELGALPEVVGDFATGGGAFWYVSASPGPGIEFGPQGPSALRRVALNGEDTVVVRDTTAVLEGLSVGSDGAYAYLVGGTLMVGRDGNAINAGTGIPIGWTDDGKAIVVDRNRAVSFKAPSGEVAETGIVLSQGVSEAWSVVLDDAAESE